MNIKMWNDVNGIIQSKNAMATKITTIVDTGRPIRSTINAPNGSAGMNSQLVKLTIAPAEDSSTPFDTRYSGPKLKGKMNAILYKLQMHPLSTTPRSSYPLSFRVADSFGSSTISAGTGGQE